MTEAKHKDTGKEMLTLIITEGKQGSVWGKSRPKIPDGVKKGLVTYIKTEKGGDGVYES